MKFLLSMTFLILFSSCSLKGEKILIGGVFKENLVLWLDGADINGDGSNVANLTLVTNWVDKSDNGNDADGSASAPFFASNSLNGLGTVSFSDGEWLDVDLGTNLDSPITVLIVCRFGNLSQPVGNDDFVFSLGADIADSHLSISRFRTPGGNGDRYYSHSGPVSDLYGPILTGLQWTIITQISDVVAPYHQVRVNGVAQSVTDFAAAINTNGNIGIGYFRAGASSHFSGNIAEIVLYDRKLSSSEIDALENYLSFKWGL